jgi:uncharacterized protein (DUF1501 family)
MVDEAIAEKASDVAKCKCVATAPQCPTPQQGGIAFGLTGRRRAGLAREHGSWELDRKAICAVLDGHDTHEGRQARPGAPRASA